MSKPRARKRAKKALSTLRQIAIAVAAVAGVLSFSANAAHAAILCLYSGSNSASASSWLAGAQAGHSWQSGSWVYGIETDISATNLKSDMSGGLVRNCPLPVPFTAAANTTGKVDWYGTARGRVGWTSGQFLFYGTAGLAYGKVRLSSNFTDTDPGVDPSSNLQKSSVRAGWVAGGGIDFMLRPNVLLNLGYQYVDLGTASLAGSASSPGGLLTIQQTASAHASFQVVTVGLSWRFAPTVSTAMDAMASAMPVKAPVYKAASNPWEGTYFGGHAGGAWGNNTDAKYDSFSPVPVQFSDVRLKRDIRLLTTLDNGMKIYAFKYLWSDMEYVGVMAQDLLANPAWRDAVVTRSDGFYAVNYAKLGLKMTTLDDWQDHGVAAIDIRRHISAEINSS